MRGRPAIPKGRPPTHRHVAQGRPVLTPHKATIVDKRCQYFSWDTGRCGGYHTKDSEYCVAHRKAEVTE